MKTRRTIGLVIGFVGVLISVGHLIFAFFDDTPERYHPHMGIVVLGFVLAVGGLLLLVGIEKKR